MLDITFGIGQVIRMLREQAGLDQEGLGLDKGTISRIELGKNNPRPETLETIARKLKTTPGEIYTTLEMLNRKVRASREEEPVCKHHKAHYELLEDILHSGKEDLIYGITVTLRAYSAGATDKLYSKLGGGSLSLEELQQSTSLPNSGEFIFDRSPKAKGGRRR
jgi:transcriptional regulator with XRE-family HTH domain